MADRSPVERALLRMSEAADALGLSRATVYELAQRGELRTVWVGAARRVPAEAIREFVAAREREATAVDGRGLLRSDRVQPPDAA